jgi:hypothetical protein
MGMNVNSAKIASQPAAEEVRRGEHKNPGLKN